MNKKFNTFSIIILLIIVVSIFSTINAYAKTIINIIDSSGSIFHCNQILKKNIGIINESISGLKKRDRFSVFLYRSHTGLFKIIDITMPKKSGGGSSNLKKARNLIRLKLQNEFKAKMKENFLKQGGGLTDCLGSLGLIGLKLEETKNINSPVIVFNFSDGFTNIGASSFDYSNQEKYFNSLKNLFKNYNISILDGLKLIDKFIWYGDFCWNSEDLNLSEIATVKINLKEAWTGFLKDKVKNIEYFTVYDN
jgi:hypothetical protein